MGKSYDIKLGYECNDACVHCVVDELRKIALKEKKTLNTDNYKKEILDGRRNGYEEIVVTGGEPTIRPDFLELIEFIKSQGLKVSLQSNGRKFKDFDFAQKTDEFVDKYVIALHGPNAEIHDAVTQRPGSFDETKRGFLNLVKLKSKVLGKIVLSNLNYEHLFETLKLYKSLGVRVVLVYFPHSSGAENYIRDIAPRFGDIKKYLQDCLDYFNDIGDFYVVLGDIFPCALDKEYPSVHFKEFFKVGSEKHTKSLLDEKRDWGLVRQAIRRKPMELCSECVFSNWCDGYWKEYIEEVGISEFKPVRKINEKVLFKYKMKDIEKILAAYD